MADYISSLTGVAMDQALLDMAEHNSEAWAVGERNGVAVGTDDVTYHNNARYYAQQAQSIAPASVTEAVRWDVAQTALTDANKEMARSNIDAGKNGAWTNPNLLDNPFFTVRQRGDGPFSGANTAAMDRWRVTSNSTITCTTNGITITTTVKKWGMQYRVTKDFFIVGKAYTISALEQDGTITNATFTWTGSGLSLYPTGSNVGFEVSTSNGSYEIIYFTTSEVGSVYLRAVKLELGSVSTLANDVPPDYGEEYRKCRRYFKRLGAWQSGAPLIGRANSATVASFIVGDEPMAKQTGITATVTGTVNVRAGDNTNHAVTAASALSTYGGGVYVELTTTGLTAYASALLVIGADSYLDLSADL